MKVIGIDIGTTSICGIVLDAKNGHLLETKTVNSQAFLPASHDWEKIQDVDKIMRIAEGLVTSFVETYKSEILAIGLTGQMHGIVYVNEKGQAVSPLYTWQDGRGNLPYQDTTYADYLGSFSGYGNVTDFYNRTNGLVPEDGVTYCTIPDYLGMRLCKNISPILHASNGASLGLYDLAQKKFHYDYHPQITDGFDVIGTFQGIPVAVAIGDNQASVFGTLANEQDLLINIGTGSQISIISDKPVTAPNIECRPYFGQKYLIVGSGLCGGRAYSLLKDFYGRVLETAGVKDADIYSLMNRMLEGKRDTSLQVDTRFAGTRTDSRLTGSICNITTSNLTPEDLTFGVLTGILDELHRMYLSMGETRFGIVASGNGIRKNKVLIQIAERMFSGKLKLPLYTEEAACGAALFALLACGAYKEIGEVQALIPYMDRNTCS